ncbi:hypothetical protein BI347_13230 [Chromobacterium sphagni]|uniref:DUF3108 domain-containing protein n=1 Tax=Chromobacterium sphagni TaxID=1903179 RepID=A0A1S1X4D5_9NEIS|nr:hypothetical protein [Chromobacterium sphagni]OHX14361.1 hypothetical protein BI347_13230 [Chromobacterium sphagni]
MKTLLICTLPALASAALAATPDLQAVVRYETVSLGADGVEKTARYSEKWIRQGGHVWRERLNAGQASHDDDGHQHLDYAAAPRHVWLDSKRQPQLEFIHSGRKERIQVAPREWSDVGFNGSWPQASQLVDLARLKGFARRRESADITLYRKASAEGGKTLRWSRRWQMPLEIEVRSADSRQRETIRVTPQALTPSTPLPWRQSAGWPARDYLDTLD